MNLNKKTTLLSFVLLFSTFSMQGMIRKKFRPVCSFFNQIARHHLIHRAFLKNAFEISRKYDQKHLAILKDKKLQLASNALSSDLNDRILKKEIILENLIQYYEISDALDSFDRTRLFRLYITNPEKYCTPPPIYLNQKLEKEILLDNLMILYERLNASDNNPLLVFKTQSREEFNDTNNIHLPTSNAELLIKGLTCIVRSRQGYYKSLSDFS
jgi:hypothetical protein